MISTKRLHYNSANRQFSAELSDLYDGNKNISWERAYPDACDLGLRVVSDKTGKEVMFAVDEEKRDREGDLQYYILRPIPADVRRVPEVKGVSFILFND